jgi:error-prone DNA polymerase
VFGSWLLLVRGRIRRASPASFGSSATTATAANAAVSVNGDECWDLAALEEIRISGGIDAVRSAMAAGDVPGSGVTPVPDAASGSAEGEDAPDEARKFVYANGFTLSPYAETGSPGAPLKDAPRNLWHASQGSSGKSSP